MSLLFKLPYLNLNFVLTLAYLNAALNDPAQVYKWIPATGVQGCSITPRHASC